MLSQKSLLTGKEWPWVLTLLKTNCNTNEVREFIALKWPGLQDEENW